MGDESNITCVDNFERMGDSKKRTGTMAGGLSTEFRLYTMRRKPDIAMVWHKDFLWPGLVYSSVNCDSDTF